MAAHETTKSAAQLEEEVNAQRDRVERTIGEIQSRLSPGQMVDELLSYAKNSAGSEFVANLGQSVRTNPLPVALIGVSLLWLAVKPATATATAAAPALAGSSAWPGSTSAHRPASPPALAPIKGSSLRRVRQATDEAGRRYSEFADDAGATFRGLTDEAGNRAGQFTDAAGASFSGFTDEAGNRVSEFLDEAGTRLETATGWASDAWRGAVDQVQGAGGALGDGAAALRRQAGAAGEQLQSGAANVTRNLTTLLHEQPLVGGALAFAVGAAVGSALPTTAQEDEIVGASADRLKAQGAKVAGDAYQSGKQQVEDLYDKATERTAETYERVKSEVGAGLGTSSASH